MLRLIVTTDLKIIITTTIVKYQISWHNSSLSQNNASESSINHVKGYNQIINRIKISPEFTKQFMTLN